jgi:NitT/TauT family transport system permease protein
LVQKQLNNNTDRRFRFIGWVVVPLALLAIWQVGAMRLDKPWLFPTVGQVFVQLVHPLRDHYASGSLLSNIAVSLLRVVIGFIIAASAGIGLGLLMGSVRKLRFLIEPTIEILRPLSAIAWLPFAIAVFKLNTLGDLLGTGRAMPMLRQVQLGMLFILFIGGFFPVLINTIDGVAGVRQQYRLLAQTLGANRRQIFVYVNLPAAMPHVLTGLRLGLARCWMVIIAAEMMPGIDGGIGYLLDYAASNSNMALVIACMVIIGGVGAGMNGLVVTLMGRYVGWKGKEY